MPEQVRKGTGVNMRKGAETGTGTGTNTETIVKKKTGRPKGSKSGYTVSEKAIAQRRKVSPITQSSRPFTGDEEMDYNSRHIDHIMKIHEIASHADIKDVESLKSCFFNYIMLCKNDGFKIGNLAACAAMGITQQTLHNWLKSSREEYRNLSHFVYTTCSLSREELIADQKINPVIGIFWQRNFDGLRNDTEQVQSLEQTREDEDYTIEDYRKKYGKLIDE